MSAGPGLIRNNFLGLGFYLLKPYVHTSTLFNVIISTGSYHSLWGIVPIFKRGTTNTRKMIEALHYLRLLVNCLLLFLSVG